MINISLLIILIRLIHFREFKPNQKINKYTGL